MISAPDINMNSVKFDWNLVDSVLMSNEYIITLPEMYTVMSVQQASFYKIITWLTNLQQTVPKIKNKK